MRPLSLLLLFLLGCGAAPTTPKKFVLFEFFGREACGICKQAGPIANQLLQELEAKGAPVLSLGYDVGPYGDPNPDLGGRRARWREVFGDKSALLPLILVQSGAEVTQGKHPDFRETYLSMIERAAKEAPTVRLSASFSRGEHQVNASIQLTNISDEALPEKASVRLFFYDDQTTMHLSHTARMIESIPLAAPLQPGQEAIFRVSYPVSKEIDVASLHLAAIVEHQSKDAQWRLAQGVIANETRSSVFEQMLAVIW